MAAYLTLVIHVALWFDPSIRSPIVRTTAIAEAAAVWRDYGIVLDFGDRAEASLCMAGFVSRARVRASGPGAVLGTTLVGPDSDEHAPPIRINFDLVDAVAYPRASTSPTLHEYAVGTAIGRVLAHEIGHILLGPPGYHDARGLMRSNFLADDFLPWDRTRYFLAESSVERLRRRKAELSMRGPAAACRAS